MLHLLDPGITCPLKDTDTIFDPTSTDRQRRSLVPIAAAEVLSDPIHLGYPGNDLRRSSDLYQLSGVVAGDELNGVNTITMNLYRCPGGIAAKKDVNPFATQLVDLSDVAAPSAEMITNPSFATDTVWEKGAGWTISGGEAVHAAGAPPSSLKQTTAAHLGDEILVKWTTNDVTPSTGRLVVILDGVVVYSFSSNTALAATNQAHLVSVPKTVPTALPLEIYATAGDAWHMQIIEAKAMVPLRFSYVGMVGEAANDAGDAIVVGLKPNTTLSNTWVGLDVRRYARS